MVYVTDSAGALLPHQVFTRIQMLKQHLRIPIGHHAHDNLGMAVANNTAAIDAGASYVDGSLLGLSAGAGNCSTGMLVAVLKKLDHTIHADLYKTMDAEDKVLIL